MFRITLAAFCITVVLTTPSLAQRYCDEYGCNGPGYTERYREHSNRRRKTERDETYREREGRLNFNRQRGYRDDDPRGRRYYRRY